MKNHDNLINNQDLTDKKNEIFIFRYDPDSSFEGMFKEFWDAVDGNKQSVEPHVVRSNSIEALTTNMTRNRLNLFATLVKKKPTSLTELARLLQKDYTVVRRDAHILEGMGIIKLERLVKKAFNGQGSSVSFKEVQPIALYKRIVFDFPIQEQISVEKPVSRPTVQP
jgi:predicted transcriptional regulator